MKQATSAEVESRVATIAEMIIKGQGREKIVRYCAKNYDIKDRQADVYISKAWDKIEKNTDFDIKQELKLQRARFEDLFQKNYTIQDYREARQVLDSIAKLLGLNEPEKQHIEHSGEVKIPRTLQDLYDEERQGPDS